MIYLHTHTVIWNYSSIFITTECRPVSLPRNKWGKHNFTHERPFWSCLDWPFLTSGGCQLSSFQMGPVFQLQSWPTLDISWLYGMTWLQMGPGVLEGRHTSASGCCLLTLSFGLILICLEILMAVQADKQSQFDASCPSWDQGAIFALFKKPDNRCHAIW